MREKSIERNGNWERIIMTKEKNKGRTRGKIRRKLMEKKRIKGMEGEEGKNETDEGAFAQSNLRIKNEG